MSGTRSFIKRLLVFILKRPAIITENLKKFLKKKTEMQYYYDDRDFGSVKCEEIRKHHGIKSF